MKKTMCKTALALVAAIAMILLVAVLMAVPAYASVDPAQYATTPQTVMYMGRILLLIVGVSVFGTPAAIATDHTELGKFLFFLGLGAACGIGGILGSKGWLW